LMHFGRLEKHFRVGSEDIAEVESDSENKI
jgi:hypothetical protein